MLCPMPYDPQVHGPRRLVGPGFQQRVHDLVRTVPPGFVVTYGDVAAALGSKHIARHVGFAMAALPPGSDVPWWRVVAAGGRLVTTSVATQRRQARQLASEGIVVKNGRIAALPGHRFAFAT